MDVRVPAASAEHGVWQNRAFRNRLGPVRVPLESKLPNVGTTIFTVMSKLAADEGAINLSQGYPDFDGPPELLERVGYYLTHGYNQYPPMAGIEPLREAIAGKVADLYGVTVSPETEVTVTSGATEGVVLRHQRRCPRRRRGDRLRPVLRLVRACGSRSPGASAVTCRCTRPTSTSTGIACTTPSARRPASSSSTRPTTLPAPSGTRTTSRDCCSVMARGDIYVVGDEVYEHILFDGRAHVSLCRYPGPLRAQLRGLLVRQDLPHDGVEGGLLRRPGSLERRIPPRAPVSSRSPPPRPCSTASRIS